MAANPEKTQKHSLSTRIVIQFCVFTFSLCVIFSLLSFLLMYVLEDSFIEKDIRSEAQYLQSQFDRTGEWPEPRQATMTLHFSRNSFPEDIREIALQEPRRIEFYGEQGRHYHILPLPEQPEMYLVAEVSAELQVRKMRGPTLIFLAISTLLVTLVASLLAWWLARKTTKPLKQLAMLVDGVAPEQIPERFAADFPENEVGVLATTLEQALDRINKALLREKHFTRDVSHELRTPLAIINNGVELMRKSSSAGQQNHAVVQRIADASHQMQQTVQTLLMLAREEHSQAPKVATPLMPVVEKAVLDNGYLLQDKAVEVSVDDSCDTQVCGAPEMLKVLLDNLISNAFQYTESGLVSISATEQTLTVRDSGPGIDARIVDDIMQPGVKGEHSTGFGFGLSIVKRLCEHQQWQVEVQSHQGTIVTVRFA